MYIVQVLCTMYYVPCRSMIVPRTSTRYICTCTRYPPTTVGLFCLHARTYPIDGSRTHRQSTTHYTVRFASLCLLHACTHHAYIHTHRHARAHTHTHTHTHAHSHTNKCNAGGPLTVSFKVGKTLARISIGTCAARGVKL